MVAAMRGGGTGPAQGELGAFAAGKSTLNRMELTGPALDAGERYKKIVADTARLDALLVGPVPGLARGAAGAHRAGRGRDGRSPARPPGRAASSMGTIADCYLPLYIFCGQQLLGARLRTADRDAADGTVEELERIVGGSGSAGPGSRSGCAGTAGSAATNCWPGARRRGWSMCWESRRPALETEPGSGDGAGPAGMRADGAGGAGVQGLPLPDAGQLEPRAARDRQGGAFAAGGQPALRGDVAGGRADGRRARSTRRCTARGAIWRTASRNSSWRCSPIAPRRRTMRANQLRLYFASFAYALLELLRRWGLSGTRLARAQCGTIRLKLLKIGVRIRVSVRAVRLSFGRGLP